MSLGQLTMFVVNLKLLYYSFAPLNMQLPDELNIRELHIYYFAWRLPKRGPQGWSLAAATNACGSWGGGSEKPLR